MRDSEYEEEKRTVETIASLRAQLVASENALVVEKKQHENTRANAETLAERLAKLEEWEKVAFERNELIEAARNAIPESEHPLEKTPHNWAWQIRTLGEDRRAAYEHLAVERDRVKKLEAALKEALEMVYDDETPAALQLRAVLKGGG